MSSENAKPDQIQASVAAALSRLRGDLSPAAPQAPSGETPRAANDLRADPFFKSIQSTPQQANQQAAQPTYQPAQPTMSSQPRAPIPMTPFTRMQAPQEPVPEDNAPDNTPDNTPDNATEASEAFIADEPDIMPTMPEPTAVPTVEPMAGRQAPEPRMAEPRMPEPRMPEPRMAEPTPSAPMMAASMPEPTPEAKPARQSVLERQGAQSGSALARFMQQPEVKATERVGGPDPVQHDLLAGLPPPPISEPLIHDTETSAMRRRRRNRMMLAGALAIVVVAIGAWLWSGGEGDTEVPVITAETTPEKIAPAEPGGIEVPNQNVQILNGETAQSQEETVMPAPEQPVAPPQATVEPTTTEAPVIEEPSATGTATTTADANAAPAAPTTEAPAVDTPPAPEVPLADVPLPAQTESATDATTAPDAPVTAAPAETATATPTEQPAAEQPAAQEPAQEPAQAQAPAAEPAATQQASVAPSATGNARIQLAAVKTEAAAKTEWTKMQKAHPQLLGALSLTVQSVVKDGTTYYRIQAGPLADKAAAKDLCASLKQQGQDCLVAK